MKQDDMYRVIGDFGRWQATVCVLASLLKLPIAWFQLSALVLEAPVRFQCSSLDNTSGGGGGWNHSQAQDIDVCSVNYQNSNTTNDTGAVECTQWVYSRDVFIETIVTQWDLVCSKSYLADLAQSTFMLGVLLGNVVFGMAADRFGRKVPLIASVAMEAFFGVASSFAPWFPVFVALRFLLAVGTGGTMVISFVLVMEVVGNSWRTSVSILSQTPFSLGVLAIAGVSYLQRDWKYFHFTISAMSAVFLFYWWVIPESPRWLLATGRYQEATEILESAARWNKRPVSEVRKLGRSAGAGGPRSGGEVAKKASFVDLMRTPNLRKHSLSLFYCWFTGGLAFFGLSQLMGRLASNIFVMIALSGIIILPGTFIAAYAVKFGRKKIIFITFLTAGVSCILMTTFSRDTSLGDWLFTGLSAAALICLSVMFPALYLFSGEIFPTVVRNVGIGSSSMFTRVGSMLAPFVKSMGVYGDYLPLVIIGVASLAGASAVLLLPETEGRRLPDSIQDGEERGRRSQEEEEEEGKNADYLPLSLKQAESN